MFQTIANCISQHADGHSFAGPGPNYWMELITTRVVLLPRVITDSMVNPFSGQYQSVTCAVPDLAALSFPAGAPLRLPLDVVAE
ncbi:MAG: hypothetical protein ACTIKR_02115, partial [Advenella sp.]